MHLSLPQSKLKVKREYYKDKNEIFNEVLDGEVPMSQQQADQYKGIIGDGQASVTVSRNLSQKDYGNGGDVFVSVALTCDQSQAGIQEAARLGAYLADHIIGQHFSELQQKCYSLGLLKPPNWQPGQQ